MEPEKRAKTLKHSQDRYRQLIALVGDGDPAQIPTHLQKLANELLTADAEFTDFLVTTLISAASLIPGKHAVYAACLVQVQAQNKDLATSFLRATAEQLQNSISSGEHLRSVLLIRLCCELHSVNSVTAESLEALLVALHAAWTACPSDFFASLLLNAATITGLKRELADEVSQWVHSTRDATWKGVLAVLGNQHTDTLQSLAGHAATGAQAQAPQYLSDVTVEAVALPEITISQDSSTVYRPSLLVFSEALDYTKLQLCRELIVAFCENPTLAAEKLERLGENRLVVMALLEAVLQLPQPAVKPVQAVAIVLNLSELGPTTWDSLLQETFATLFNSADNLDLAGIDALASFLALYLCNNNLHFTWDLFVGEALGTRQRLLLHEVLDRLTRLCDQEEAVKPELPVSLHAVLPPLPEPVLRFTDIEESVDNTDCQLIIDRINSKASIQEMRSLLSSKEICNSGEFLFSIFAECVFYQGAKSMMHITTYLERYEDIFRTIPRTVILEALWNVWQSSTQRIVLLAKKLLQMQLVAPMEVAELAVAHLGKGDTRSDFNKREWQLLDLSVNLATEKRTVLEFICSATDSLLTEGNTDRLLGLLRANLSTLRTSEGLEVSGSAAALVQKVQQI